MAAAAAGGGPSHGLRQRHPGYLSSSDLWRSLLFWQRFAITAIEVMNNGDDFITLSTLLYFFLPCYWRTRRGDHAEDPELEPSRMGDATDAECMINATCLAPMYFWGTDYLGMYSTIADHGLLTTNQHDFSLDVYKPEFFYPLDQWASATDSAGPYQVYLNFNKFNYTLDILYFCHIHQSMGGRIKLLDDDSNPINTEGDISAL
ncbi:hypothetical protein ACA910_012106 [Epithemia clementina (nom. ined.)]